MIFYKKLKLLLLHATLFISLSHLIQAANPSSEEEQDFFDQSSLLLSLFTMIPRDFNYPEYLKRERNITHQSKRLKVNKLLVSSLMERDESDKKGKNIADKIQSWFDIILKAKEHMTSKAPRNKATLLQALKVQGQGIVDLLTDKEFSLLFTLIKIDLFIVGQRYFDILLNGLALKFSRLPSVHPKKSFLARSKDQASVEIRNKYFAKLMKMLNGETQRQIKIWYQTLQNYSDIEDPQNKKLFALSFKIQIENLKNEIHIRALRYFILVTILDHQIIDAIE